MTRLAGRGLKLNRSSRFTMSCLHLVLITTRLFFFEVDMDGIELNLQELEVDEHEIRLRRA